MENWQHYLVVLQQDLLALAWLLTWVGGALLFHSALIAISAAARHRQLRPKVIWIAVLISWLVGTVTVVGTYLLGVGIVTQFFRISHLKPTEVPPLFWPVLICVSVVIAVVLSYRRTAAWIKAGVDDKPAPLRVRFSLGTLLLYQLILLLCLGLWIECRRDWVTEYQEQQRIAEHLRWEGSIEERFGSLAWEISHSGHRDPERFLTLRVERYDTRTNDIPKIDAAVVERLEVHDQLMLFHFRCDNLNQEAMESLSRQQKLADLYIVSQSLTDSDLKPLKRLPNLQHLILRCPQLTDAALDILAGMKAEIWIESPLVTRAAVETHQGKREGDWVMLSEMARS